MAAEGDSGKLHADIFSSLSNNVDLLSEILLRLPSKSLMRFKAVCKSWRALIISRYFCSLWRQHIIKLPMKQFQPLGTGPASSVLKRQMIFMILQFLDEENFKESARKLGEESGFFFDIQYFDDQVLAGEWEEVERYLSGFLKVNDNDESKTIFTEIMKQKNFENVIREQKKKFLADIMSQRKALIDNLRRPIQLNPLLHYKLEFPPALAASSLIKMIESHIIQHELCKDSNPSPDGDLHLQMATTRQRQ